MANQSFTYHGPPSGATLRLERKEALEVLFHPGERVDLPPDHPYVKRLVNNGRLVAVEKPTRKATESSASKAPPQEKATSTRKSKENS